MKKKTQKEIFNNYPKIFRQHTLPPSQTAMVWGLECGEGWMNLIDTLCHDIQTYIDENHTEQIEATQVKQKFGGLRFYYRPYNKIIDELIHKASEDSFDTCENCGDIKDVQLSKKGWITPMCKMCRLLIGGEK